ncbi:MAG: hypothetical protein WBA16_01230 [Nonlabens sp.]
MSNLPIEQQEQEVDLVPVFQWIGNGFKRFFRGIGSFFKAIATGFVLFLIFIKNNIILIGVVTTIGLALGIYKSYQGRQTYSAVVRVKPNFDSNSQIISQIKNKRSLIREGAYDRLASELGISREEAETLNDFDIEPFYNDTELLREYDQMSRNSDTMALKETSFDDFKDAMRPEDYEVLEVTINADSKVALQASIDKAIVVEETADIKARKLASRETVKFNIKAITYQLTELDSLISSYQEAIRNNVSTGGNSTNLYMTDQDQASVLQDLFVQKSILLRSLENERIKFYSYDDTIVLLSSSIVKGSMSKKSPNWVYPFIFLGFGLLIALIPVLWRALNTYEQNYRRQRN